MTQANSTDARFVAVLGTCDTKGDELRYVRDLIRASGLTALLIDVDPRGQAGADADICAPDIRAARRETTETIAATTDRGVAITAMSRALADWSAQNSDRIIGMIGIGGSGNTALITPGMRALDIGVPKIMVSTVASGNVAPYVGPSDIAMLYSVVDIAGLNSISRRVLGNAAHMIAGAVSRGVPEAPGQDKPAIGLTMFGVTTPCVERIVSTLADRYECLVFHATGTGGQTMEKLADSNRLCGLIDVTTTEVADLLVGGIMSAGEDRMGAAIRTGLPYVGSCGALDMVNFGARDTVPPQFQDRQLYVHNEHVTLMRTTPADNARIGAWIGARLNQMTGPVRFFLPMGGVSVIDLPGAPFHDPEADAALFAALEDTVIQTEDRQLIRLPHAINDPECADALCAAFLDISKD